MPSTLDAYFAAERAESLAFLAFGLAAVLVAAFLLWRVRDPLFRGMAIPLFAVGLIQIAVGATIVLRADAQVASLKAQAEADPAAFRTQELARMSVVGRSFTLYKLVEVGFVLVGLGLALWRKGPRFWRGFGLGMLMQGALMLPADLLAEARAADYVAWLTALP